MSWPYEIGTLSGLAGPAVAKESEMPKPKAEKAAMEWLDHLAKGYKLDSAHGNFVSSDVERSIHARLILAMLAEPRLPAELSEGMIEAMLSRSGVRASYQALYAHLTAPKTKTVWRVSGCGRARAPYLDTREAHDRTEINNAVSDLQFEGFSRITITTHEVPCD